MILIIIIIIHSDMNNHHEQHSNQLNCHNLGHHHVFTIRHTLAVGAEEQFRLRQVSEFQSFDLY